MFITNLNKMDKIVSGSKDLEWDGWDVARYTPSHTAMFSTDGVYKNGKWFKKKVFPVTENGWDIPESIGQKNAKMER
jgi:hypothetical protein